MAPSMSGLRTQIPRTYTPATGRAAGGAAEAAAGGAADRRGGGGTAGGEESRRALERQIAAAARQRQTLRAGHILPAAAFADEANESEEKCLRGGHDALRAVAAHDSVGGGEVYSDVASAAHLAAGTLPKAAQLKALRAHLEQAKRTLAAALPSLGSLLEGTVKAGFDVGGAYLGFCSERAIVVNLAPLLRRWNEAGTPVELLLTRRIHGVFVGVAYRCVHPAVPSCSNKPPHVRQVHA